MCTECVAAARLEIELLRRQGNLVDDEGKPLPRVHLLHMATAALRCAHCDPSRSAFLARRGRAVSGVNQTDAAEYGALSADESRRLLTQSGLPTSMPIHSDGHTEEATAAESTRPFRFACPEVVQLLAAQRLTVWARKRMCVLRLARERAAAHVLTTWARSCLGDDHDLVHLTVHTPKGKISVVIALAATGRQLIDATARAAGYLNAPVAHADGRVVLKYGGAVIDLDVSLATQGVRSDGVLQLDGRGLGGQPLLVRLRELLRVWQLMQRGEGGTGDREGREGGDVDDHHMQWRSALAAVRQMSDGNKVVINIDLDVIHFVDTGVEQLELNAPHSASVVTIDDRGEVMRVPVDGFDALDANGLVPAPHGTWLRVTDAYDIVCWLERHGGAAAESTMAWATEHGCADRIVVDVSAMHQPRMLRLTRWQPPPPTPMLMAAQAEALEGSQEYRVPAAVLRMQELLRESEGALLAEQRAADHAGDQAAPAPVPPSPKHM